MGVHALNDLKLIRTHMKVLSVLLRAALREELS